MMPVMPNSGFLALGPHGHLPLVAIDDIDRILLDAQHA